MSKTSQANTGADGKQTEMLAIDEFGCSPLHYAVIDGDLATVERLVAGEDDLADAGVEQ